MSPHSGVLSSTITESGEENHIGLLVLQSLKSAACSWVETFLRGLHRQWPNLTLVWAAHLRMPSEPKLLLQKKRSFSGSCSHSEFVLEDNCHSHASTQRGTKGLPLGWRAPRNTDGNDLVLPAKSGNRWAISNIQKLTVKELGERLCLEPKLSYKPGQRLHSSSVTSLLKVLPRVFPVILPCAIPSPELSTEYLDSYVASPSQALGRGSLQSYFSKKSRGWERETEHTTHFYFSKKNLPFPSLRDQ